MVIMLILYNISIMTYTNYCYNSSSNNTYSYKKKSLNRRYNRKLKRLVSKSESLNVQKKLIQIQKFSIIYFIGNPSIDIKNIFKALVDITYDCFQMLLNWIVSLFPALTGTVLSFNILGSLEEIP